jgi:hypothetical protein
MFQEALGDKRVAFSNFTGYNLDAKVSLATAPKAMRRKIDCKSGQVKFELPIRKLPSKEEENAVRKTDEARLASGSQQPKAQLRWRRPVRPQPPADED